MLDLENNSHLEYLVIDAGAIIRGQGFSFLNLARIICTVAEVIKEIRDSKSRHILDTLPYPIEIISPSESGMKAVINFSKKTGDFAALSLTDIKLIALVYTLETKLHGSSRLERKINTVHSLSETVTKNARMLSSSCSPASEAQVTSENWPEERSQDTCCNCDTIDPSLYNLAVESTDSTNQPAVKGEELQGATCITSDISYVGISSPIENDNDCSSSCSSGDSDTDSSEDDIEHTDSTHHTNQSIGDAAIDANDTKEAGSSVELSDKNDQSQQDLSGTTMILDTCVDDARGTALDIQSFPPLPPTSNSDSLMEAVVAPGPLVVGSSWVSIASKNLIKSSDTIASAPAFRSISASGSRADVQSTTDSTSKCISSSVHPVISSTILAQHSTSIPAPDTSTRSHAPSTTSVLTKQSNRVNPTSRHSQPSAYTSFDVRNKKLQEEDDSTGWINTSNISTFRANGLSMDSMNITTALVRPVTAREAYSPGADESVDNSAAVSKKKKSPKPIDLACITTDFTIQNVLFQLGLRVLSVDGLIIKKIKKFVLRCVGCFTLHHDMDRMFCSKCGGSSLTRVSCSIDSKTGQLKLHLKSNYQVNLKGTLYSLPKPGNHKKHHGEILLREDQLMSGIWKQKYNAAKKEIKTSFLNEDVVSGDVGFHPSKLSQSGIQVGYGKKNPNAVKGRERRGKKKSN